MTARLTPKTARVGMRVVCRRVSGPFDAGEEFVVIRCENDTFVVDNKRLGPRFVYHTDDFIEVSPALPALTPELLDALREMHDVYGGEPNKWLGVTARKLLAAIEAAPGILAPPAPTTTDVQPQISEGWWA